MSTIARCTPVGPQDREEFVGRSAELSALHSALDRVRSGHPQTVLIHGGAGMGKTTLVEHFLRGESGMSLLRASGEQWETLVPYGVVEQVLRASGRARRGCSPRGCGRCRPRSRSASARPCLELFAEFEEKNVVVLVIDDAHWSDIDSLRALLFALRRLVSERVLAILTVREEDELRLPDGLRRLAAGASGLTLRLGPLTPQQIQSLASAVGVTELFRPHRRAAARAHGRQSPVCPGAASRRCRPTAGGRGSRNSPLRGRSRRRPPIDLTPVARLLAGSWRRPR